MTITESTRAILSASNDQETVISVENVSKKFCRDLKQSLFYGVQDIATDLVGGKRRGDNVRLQIAPGQIELQVRMPHFGLAPGVYSAKIYVRQGVRSFDVVESFRFTVKTERTMSRCLFYQPRTWRKSIQKEW